VIGSALTHLSGVQGGNTGQGHALWPQVRSSVDLCVTWKEELSDDEASTAHSSRARSAKRSKIGMTTDSVPRHTKPPKGMLSRPVLQQM
jgi:hypothetical protein